ncbi:MAG TPA: CBS domain-containing protein [Bryobacteraceae bacterium]|nr:CBS domain-containing protein [Bryobacteraceae bacterium]
MATCNDIMTLNPTCLASTESITRASEVMKNEDVGAVPVVEDEQTKKLIGIITDRDIVINVIAERKSLETTVDEVMTRNPVTCRPDDSIQNAMDRMAQHQVRRIPVVDGKDRVVGIISQADLATRLDHPEKTADVLEDISQPV